MQISFRKIKTLPKADLHSHIDGSVSPKELFRIAKSHRRKILTPGGGELDSVSAFMGYIAGGGYDTLLEDVVNRFYPITGVMQSEETIRDVGIAYVRGQKEDGVVYAEGRFAPQYHTREGLPLKDVIASMAGGLAEGSERYGVKTALIVAIGRESSPSQGVTVAKAASGSSSVVALDLGGPEAGNPPGKFEEAFSIAAESGLKTTVHAGEGAGSLNQNLENMEQAVTRLKANRLGHAIDLAGSRRLTSLVKRKSVAIEMNPISNLVLHKIHDLKQLSIERLLGRGVNISINSDDPSLWPDGNLSHVFLSVCEAYGFGMEEVDTLIENSFKGAFAPEKERSLLVDQYRAARRRSTASA